jgi:hypothetical protein
MAFRDPSSIENDGRRPARSVREPVSARQLVLQQGRETVLVRHQAQWRTGAVLPPDALRAWLGRARNRDLALFAMLSDHRYLTTDQIREVFFPGRSLRVAQRHLRRLATDLQLVMRWFRLEPVPGGPTSTPYVRGWRRRPSLWLLTERGAALLAQHRGADVASMVKRSFMAAEYTYRLEHDLEVNAFWVDLVSGSRSLQDQGLYNWVGDDAMRRSYQELGVDLAPDGWGRYLTPDHELLISLEWDRGSEAPQRLSRKARAYLSFRAGRGEHNHVLVVLPGVTRESGIRAAISRVLTGARSARFWTTHRGLLQERGPLGDIWQEVGVSGERRVELAVLPGPARSERRAQDCIGRPGWWDR